MGTTIEEQTSLNPFYGRMTEALEEIARGPHTHSITITIVPAMTQEQIEAVVDDARQQVLDRTSNTYVEGCPSCTATQCLVEITKELEKREAATQNA